jgi:hypothetical protein
MGVCPNSPAADRSKPARSAGTFTMAISTPASSARIAKGWLWKSGTYVKFTDAGAELFT